MLHRFAQFALALLIVVPFGSSAGSASADAVTDLGLFVTEIAPNTAGADHYEFFEVTNVGSTPVDLSALVLRYVYSPDATASDDVELNVPAGTTVGAGETVVLWMNYLYGADEFDLSTLTDQQFRDHWAANGQPGADYRIARVTGQPGLANGGDRGILIGDGDAVTRSFYGADDVGTALSAHFGRATGDPYGSGTTVHASAATATPGAVDPEALTPIDVTPEPDPEPEPGADPDPDPDLETAALHITEVTPDTSNLDGSDAYEFIEVYNATTEPIDLADYTIDYLYPAADLSTNNNVANWQPADDLVVQPASTVVFWIKNGKNDHLTDSDFNAHFGSSATMGVDLAEIFVGGMANGSLRGLEMRTRSGDPLNRAYYNVGGVDDTSPNIGIQYRHDANDHLRQQLVDHQPATPGFVGADQVPDGLMIPPADDAAPTVADATADLVDPTADFEIAADITDDVGVRRVSVSVQGSADPAPLTTNLQFTPDRPAHYATVIDAVDLTGLRWIEYSFEVSDGTHLVTTEPIRVPVDGVDRSPVRLNVADGTFVSATTPLIAAGDVYPPQLSLTIDGSSVGPLADSLEGEPVFAFEATSTDAFFRNGVLIGDEVLHIFDEGFYADEVTVATDVPLEHITAAAPVTVSVYAGTKAAPEIDPDENNDNFRIRNPRLILPDGRTLRPDGYTDPGAWIDMGDSGSTLDVYDAVFAVPGDAFTGAAYDWDTTAVADGPHTVGATDGSTEIGRTVEVDNTAPIVDTALEDGRTYQGEIVIAPTVTDAGAGVDRVVAFFDGDEVELPHTTSSLELDAGTHELRIEAADLLGNAVTTTVSFVTPVEAPSATPVRPADGSTVKAPTVPLRAEVVDPSADELTVSIRRAARFTADVDGFVATAGTVRDAAAIERDGIVIDPAALVADDGDAATVESDDELPYQRFDIEAPADLLAGDDAEVRVRWNGSAEPGAEVLLSVRDAATGGWTRVGRTLATSDDIDLEAVVPAADHVVDGVVQVLVQHTEGYAGTAWSARDDDIAPHHPDDVPRSDYDFTLGWESDTQYYNEEFYDHQLAIHEYLLDRRDELNLQYLSHTGDIVDDYDQEYQWLNADPAYRMLDAAGLPYGVLAGNHDVGGALADYSEYRRWFGAARFENNPWWGGDFADNRGHYDLISVDGVDFIMIYQGWDPGDDEIDWLNDVLARYPDRVAVLNLHEYMLTTGGLGPIPQRIYDEVIATNPNVRMVFSGHYHDAFTRVDRFDDDGDGTPERPVYQMLFDYQGLPEGGLGYLRLLHFDHVGERMLVRTYSPSLDDYNADDPSLELEHQQFDVPYGELGIAPATKTLGTDYVAIDVLGGSGAEIGSRSGVASGSSVTTPWRGLADGQYGWYARAVDPHGAVGRSAVATFEVRRPGGARGPRR